MTISFDPPPLPAWRRYLPGSLILAAGLILVGGYACTLGAVQIDIPKILREAWTHGIQPHGEATIFWYVRLPRVVLAACVGGVLAASGAAFQAVLRNPLADPFILGISGGAALGALAATLAQSDRAVADPLLVSLGAFAGALSTVFIVHRIAWTSGRLPVQTLLLAGVVVNAFYGAQILLLTTLVSPARLAVLLTQMSGTIPEDGPRIVAIVAGFSVVGLAAIWALAWPLNLISTGEETAQTLGIDVERVKRWTFIAASLATGVVVSRAGLIGFVGLIVPHVIRLIWGPDHRFLIPASIAGGAMLVMASDGLARTLLSSDLPVGVVTASLGAPFFLYLLWREARRA